MHKHLTDILAIFAAMSSGRRADAVNAVPSLRGIETCIPNGGMGASNSTWNRNQEKFSPKASTQTLAPTKLSYHEYKQIGVNKNIRVIGVIRGRKTWTTEMGEKESRW